MEYIYKYIYIVIRNVPLKVLCPLNSSYLDSSILENNFHVWRTFILRMQPASFGKGTHSELGHGKKMFITSYSMRLTLILHFTLKSFLNSGLSTTYSHSGFNSYLKYSFIFGRPFSKSQISHREGWNNQCGNAQQKLQKGGTSAIFSGVIINYLVL